jgi:hypothetical protein
MPAFDHAIHLERALSVLALRLRHEVALHRALRGDVAREGFGGLFLDGDEAEEMLADMAGRLAASGTAEPLAIIERLEDDLSVARRAEGSIWARLSRVFGLDDPALDLVAAAAAPAIDPRFGRIYGFLADDMSRRYLTPAVALRLLARHRPGLAELRSRLRPDAPLAAWGLIQPLTERPMVEAPIRLDEDLVDLLLTGGTFARPERAVLTEGPWLGLRGSEAEARLKTLAGDRGTVMVALHSLGLRRDLARDWRVRARGIALDGDIPVLVAEGALAVLPGDRRAIAQALGPGQVLLTDDPHSWIETGLQAEWLATGASSLPSPGMILRDRTMAGLADRIIPLLDLEDLVLTPKARSALGDLVTAFGQMGQVLDSWGFGGVWGKAPGLAVLFKGPSGTGKTTAAGGVAARLGLPIYRVNLAGLMSKYIGETEKHLDRLFSAAAGREQILFFDEADAAFGKRSDVSDAHDRYANLGTAFLLQRLETHTGLTILATNLQENIDDAFLRRLDAVIDFPAPGRDERETLWRRLELTGAPMHELDFAALSDHTLTGGEIRNASLAAAYRAAEAGGRLTMEGIARAIAQELAKKGRPVRRADFKGHYAAGRGMS